MNNTKIVLVKSRGRCGTHLILEFFQEHGYDIKHSYKELPAPVLENNKNYIIHDHLWHYIPDLKDNLICLLVRRKDIKKQALSIALVEYLKNTKVCKNRIYHSQHDFSKELDKFYIDPKYFQDLIIGVHRHNIQSQEIIENNEIPYEILYYEDIITNPSYFYKFLNVNPSKKTWNLNKNKTNPLEMISNVEELLSLDVDKII